MKSKLMVGAMLAALCCGPVLAREKTGWVYNGLTGVGSISQGDLGDSSLSSNSNFGYRWGQFGVEVGHTYFSKFKDQASVGGTTFDVDSKVGGWNAGVDFNKDLSPRWSLQGRAGVFAWNSDSRISDGLQQVSGSDSGRDWYAGGSIDYSWRKRSSVGFGYTRFKAGDADLSLWGLHSEFRF